MNKFINYVAFSSVNFVIANKIGYYFSFDTVDGSYKYTRTKQPVRESLKIAILTPFTLPYFILTTSLACSSDIVDWKR